MSKEKNNKAIVGRWFTDLPPCDSSRGSSGMSTIGTVFLCYKRLLEARLRATGNLLDSAQQLAETIDAELANDDASDGADLVEVRTALVVHIDEMNRDIARLRREREIMIKSRQTRGGPR